MISSHFLSLIKCSSKHVFWYLNKQYVATKLDQWETEEIYNETNKEAIWIVLGLPSGDPAYSSDNISLEKFNCSSVLYMYRIFDLWAYAFRHQSDPSTKEFPKDFSTLQRYKRKRGGVSQAISSEKVCESALHFITSHGIHKCRPNSFVNNWKIGRQECIRSRQIFIFQEHPVRLLRNHQ